MSTVFSKKFLIFSISLYLFISEILSVSNFCVISGLTLSGGDPLHEENIKEVPKKVKEKDVFIVDVEERLRNIFGTKVNISKGKKKGKIEIEYYNEDDLNNIVSMLLEDN